MQPVIPKFAFTTKASGRARELVNDISVGEFYHPRSGKPEPKPVPCRALWDTGATNSMVSRRVLDELKLAPSGRVTVVGIGSGDEAREEERDTFLVNINLPNNVTVVGVRVAEGFVSGADVLLGMDIITQGDLAITNVGGQTWWTFRVPSSVRADFVEEIREGRNVRNVDGRPLNRQERRRLTRSPKKS